MYGVDRIEACIELCSLGLSWIRSLASGSQWVWCRLCLGILEFDQIVASAVGLVYRFHNWWRGDGIAGLSMCLHRFSCNTIQHRAISYYVVVRS